MEQKTIFDYMITCESCGRALNLYDIPDGVCPACDADVTAEKKDLMKVLLAQDVFFDCDENGRIVVPENAGQCDEQKSVTKTLKQNMAPQTQKKAVPKPLQEKEKAGKPEKPVGIHFKGQFSEIEYYKHEVIQVPDEGKMIVLVYFHFKNLAGKPKCFLDCPKMQIFQHGMEQKFYPNSFSKEASCSGTEILPGYSLDVAQGFEIQDYSDVVLRYVPWDEDFDLEFTQTLHLEEGKSSDGFEMTFLENRIMDFMRDFIHEKLLQDNNYVRLMRQFERSRPKTAGKSLRPEEEFMDSALLVFYLNWMHDHLTKKDLEAAVQQMEKRRREAEASLEFTIYLDSDSDGSDLLDDYNDLEVEWEPDDDSEWDADVDSDDFDAAPEFYEPPVDYEDDDAIALDMEESIDDAIMFHGGNPFDWDTRSDFLDDPLGFGDDDDF